MLRGCLWLSRSFQNTVQRAYSAFSGAKRKPRKKSYYYSHNLYKEWRSFERTLIGSRRPEFTKLNKFTRWSPYSPPTSGMIYFGIHAGWLLRHGAKNLRFPMRPDGYIRVGDALSHEGFNGMDREAFLYFATHDPPGRFQVVNEKEIVGGVMREVQWIRARKGHTIPGVDHATQRIFSAEKLPVVAYKTVTTQLDHIRQHGIPANEDGLIHMTPNPIPQESDLLETQPNQPSLLFVHIDVEKALADGIKFYVTRRKQVLSEGNHDNVIPPTFFKDVVGFDVTKEMIE